MVVMEDSVKPGQGGDGSTCSCQLEGKSGLGLDSFREQRELVAFYRQSKGFLGTGGGSKLLVKRFTSERTQPCRTATAPRGPRAAGPNLQGSQAGFRNDSQNYPPPTTSLWGGGGLEADSRVSATFHAAAETISQTRGRRGMGVRERRGKTGDTHSAEEKEMGESPFIFQICFHPWLMGEK